MIKTYFNWSGGKDSSFALFNLLRNSEYKVDRLLTTVNGKYGRISMHGVREELLDKQAKEIGIPLEKIYLPEQPSMAEYAEIMRQKVVEMKSLGLTTSVFGDIFLEDLKKYREEELAKEGVQAYFPIWKRDTKEVLQEFIRLGFKAVLVCVKSEVLDKSFAGREIDADFLKDLPKDVDPCGEHGEFHTFVYDGPIFKNPISFDMGETIYREYGRPKTKDEVCDDGKSEGMGFWFTDLTLKK